jgi:hypothetical protein
MSIFEPVGKQQRSNYFGGTKYEKGEREKRENVKEKEGTQRMNKVKD